MKKKPLLELSLGRELKTVPGIHDPRIAGLPFGIKNHKMRGPPVTVKCLKKDTKPKTDKSEIQKIFSNIFSYEMLSD